MYPSFWLCVFQSICWGVQSFCDSGIQHGIFIRGHGYTWERRRMRNFLLGFLTAWAVFCHVCLFHRQWPSCLWQKRWRALTGLFCLSYCRMFCEIFLVCWFLILLLFWWNLIKWFNRQLVMRMLYILADWSEEHIQYTAVLVNHLVGMQELENQVLESNKETYS